MVIKFLSDYEGREAVAKKGDTLEVAHQAAVEPIRFGIAVSADLPKKQRKAEVEVEANDANTQ